MIVGREEDFHWSKLWSQIQAETEEAELQGVRQSQMLGLYLGSYFQGILEYCTLVSEGIFRGRGTASLENHMNTRLFGIMGVPEFDIPKKEQFVLINQVR